MATQDTPKKTFTVYHIRTNTAIKRIAACTERGREFAMSIKVDRNTYSDGGYTWKMDTVPAEHLDGLDYTFQSGQSEPVQFVEGYELDDGRWHINLTGYYSTPPKPIQGELL
jgi:hypothetical protein